MIQDRPYLKYLRGASEAIDYGRQMAQTNPVFKRFLLWCEAQKPISRSTTSTVPNCALDSIQSSPHQRITRYGILLDPILKFGKDEPYAQQLAGVHKEVDALCRWLNNRVKLSEIDKQIVSVSFAHLKVESDTAKAQLSHYSFPKNSFDIFAPIPNSIIQDEKRCFRFGNKIVLLVQ